MKRARKRPIESLVHHRPTFVEVLRSMPNVGTDADFDRLDAVDEMLQFMRDAELSRGASFDLKQLIEDGRS